VNNLFKKIESDKFNHAKKYAQLLSSSENDLLICDDQEFVNDTLTKSIKMGTLTIKDNGKTFEVNFRNISGCAFAYYPENNLIIVGKRFVNKILG